MQTHTSPTAHIAELNDEFRRSPARYVFLRSKNTWQFSIQWDGTKAFPNRLSSHIFLETVNFPIGKFGKIRKLPPQNRRIPKYGRFPKREYR